MVSAPRNPSVQPGRYRSRPTRKKARKRRSAKVFSAKLPPKKPGEEYRIKHYASEQKARAAQRCAWAAFQAKHKLREAARGLGEADPRAEHCNRNEQRFIDWAAEHALSVHRAGWPDFLCRSPRGRIAAVEVKSTSDPLSSGQIQCMRLLEKAGVESYVWTRKQGLEPWKQYVSAGPVASRGVASKLRQDDGHEKRGEQPKDPTAHAGLPSEKGNPGVLGPASAQGPKS